MLCINDSTDPLNIKPTSLIKVTGFVTIEDYEHLSYFMENCNDIGMAIAYLQIFANKGTNSQSNNSVDKYAKDHGLTMEKKLSSSIVKIIEHLHGKSLELVIDTGNPTHGIVFKTLLDQAFLRISPNTIRNLYSYKPCMKWTIVGEVTDISNNTERHPDVFTSVLSEMFKHLNDIDKSLSKETEVSNNTIRIAPIAVYIEHDSIDN